MHVQSLLHSSHTPFQTLEPRFFSQSLFLSKKLPPLLAAPEDFRSSFLPPSLRTIKSRSRLVTPCVSPSQELVDNTVSENDANIASDSLCNEEEKEEEMKMEVSSREVLENQSLWNQIKEIVKFTAPATGLWICGPLMSLIDTAVIGQGSSLELAALGTILILHWVFIIICFSCLGNVLGQFCDNMSYVFMFLSISTSNMVATSLAKQIRGLAWPAILIGWVAQSASLGMKDSWGPLKALIVASAINGIGDILLCRFLDYGIAGAAWATMVSQVVAAYMMIDSLNKKGYNAYAISVPSPTDLMTIFGLAAPVFVVMMSKVAFYSLLVYFATSMGTLSLAAHQVMIQAFVTCTVWGEPLSQTAQSFMPEMMYGMKRSLAKARTLLKSLTIIGIMLGLMLGIVGTSVPWLFPKIFTPDQNVIQEMHKVLIPFFMALAVTPCILGFEGTLLAGRDLKYLSLSMGGCFSLGAVVLW
ncbi:hypothetical protein GH714_031274 [Hevea brasiliensis]|uniref:Multidrug and toxic compound extrusion protein n=1 Tax=Hevea brasiliensis TaxID=3981 RepID=A0A6A6NDU1_HEVBR|nr:hypothetical protein GH714_031274 [Hevea brasiliensis]